MVIVPKIFSMFTSIFNRIIFGYALLIELQSRNMKNIKNSLRGCLKLKNGDVREFVDHIHYGDELWFLYEGKKYFLEGWTNNGSLDLCLYEMTDNGEKHTWKGNTTHYPVEAFLEAKIWNGKSFWDAEQDIEWVDD